MAERYGPNVQLSISCQVIDGGQEEQVESGSKCSIAPTLLSFGVSSPGESTNGNTKGGVVRVDPDPLPSLCKRGSHR
jgi:hypothetical protein